MRIHKFGGASVKDAEGIRHVASLIQDFSGDDQLIVLSAMGKTTNALEKVAESHFTKDGEAHKHLKESKDFHQTILSELFDEKDSIYDAINNVFVEIEWALEDPPRDDFGFEYDQIVSQGEILSTLILSHYLHKNNTQHQWLDVRDLVRTNNVYRNARVDWDLTVSAIQEMVKPGKLYLTQGFLGCTSENFTTTLGREGSDYTAAIFAFALNADEVNVWKDVPGMLNADPRFFKETTLIENLSFYEAIELAYYGAKVIHPKTIQPLQRKSIPLRIRSFQEKNSPGTLIGEGLKQYPQVPFFIVKKDQTLVSISSKDFAFIVEDHLSEIFATFAKYGISVNVMQNSAISFSVCFDSKPMLFEKVLKELEAEFHVLYNHGLTMYTIRHYTADAVEKLIKGKNLVLEQKSRHTLQIVVDES